MKIAVSLCVIFVIAAVSGGLFLLFSTFVSRYEVSNKRRRWIIAGAVVALVALVVSCSGLLRAPIDLTKVERMELHTYDHVRMEQVELTQSEQWMIAFLYNISPRGGEITAEPCCDAYRVEVYYNDGRKLFVSENGASIMNVRVRDERERDNFCAACPLLVEYILILAEKYELPID